MKRCVRCLEAKPLNEFTMRSVATDRRESACRSCRAIARRQSRERQKVLAVSRLEEPRGGIYYTRIPCERLLPLVETWRREHPEKSLSESLMRARYRMLHEQTHVGFDFADRLLTALDLSHEWHGELADIYEQQEEVAA